MPQPNEIPPDKLLRLIGTSAAPLIVDVREMDAAGASLFPGAKIQPAHAVAQWAASIASSSVVVVCEKGGAASHGVAAWLRASGLSAEVLEGGYAAWEAGDLPLIRADRLPPRDPAGRTIWVTRARPKVDRIACPWLIRRFVDPDAMFLFVPPGDVAGVVEQFGATPFDVAGDGMFWTHRGERCTFDVMVEEFGLGSLTPLTHLAKIVRGADTARPELVPEAAGLLAISLGLSRTFADDNTQLDAGMVVYDALYRWCRDARGETHDWTSHQPRGDRT